MSTSGLVMSPSDPAAAPRTHGDVLTAISDGMVALLKEFYGHGPTRTKSYYADDLVVCVLRGGFSRVEQTLLAGGRGEAVIQQRMEFQEVMRAKLAGVERVSSPRPGFSWPSTRSGPPEASPTAAGAESTGTTPALGGRYARPR